MIFTARNGNTLAEYAVMIGLLVLVSIGAMKLLGNSIQSLFSSPDASLASQPVQDMVSLKFGGTGAGGMDVVSAAGQVKAGSVSNGKLSDQLVSESVSAGTNATSVDGNTGTKAIMKSLGLIQKISALAEQQTDPSLKLKLERLAVQGYYLSVAESGYEYSQNHTDNPLLKELAGLAETPGYSLSDNPAIAVRAIQHKISQVGTKATDYLNDPAASPQDKAIIKQLAQEIYSLANKRYGAKIEEYKTTNFGNLGCSP